MSDDTSGGHFELNMSDGDHLNWIWVMVIILNWIEDSDHFKLNELELYWIEWITIELELNGLELNWIELN